MKNVKQILIITLLTAYTVIGGMFLQETTAQSIKIADTIDPNYFGSNDDMKSYQIICKEHAKEYTSYYQAIREKIIQKLKYNYSDYYRYGDINLFFVLNSNGSLGRIDLDTGKSTNDKKLINITLLSLQQASPFPPFPKELQTPYLPFSLTISFKENNN